MSLKTKKFSMGQIILNLIFILICIMYIVPFILMISISLSDESSLIEDGYKLFPKEFSLSAYEMVFQNPTQILNSYKVTIIYSAVSTVLSIFFMSLLAYSLARSNFKLRKGITFYVFFTMLFNGGMVPNYLLITKYLGLNDTIWAYILPGMIGAWNVIIMRTNFKNVPESLIESAKLDGASEFYICFRIIMPLCKPTLAAIAFLYLIPKWNDWMTAMLYIKDPELYSLQYLLQRILQETEFLKTLAESGATVTDSSMFPTESLKFAMALIAAGPVMVVFPFFQKYFAKGLTLGAVKG